MHCSMIIQAWHKKLTHFISLTSPLPASRQSSRATKNSSRSVLYQTYNCEKSKRFKIDYYRYLAEQHILDIKLSTQYNWQYSNLFFRRLHTLGHLQPSTLLCHHVHLRPTESDYKNQQSVITNHTKLYLFSNRAKLTGWAHWPEGRCLRTNSLV